MFDMDLEAQKKLLSTALMQSLQKTFGNRLSNEMTLQDPSEAIDGIPRFLKEGLDPNSKEDKSIIDKRFEMHKKGVEYLTKTFEALKNDLEDIHQLSKMFA